MTNLYILASGSECCTIFVGILGGCASVCSTPTPPYRYIPSLHCFLAFFGAPYPFIFLFCHSVAYHIDPRTCTVATRLDYHTSLGPGIDQENGSIGSVFGKYGTYIPKMHKVSQRPPFSSSANHSSRLC